MTLVASILAPAVTGIALAMEPPQAPWSTPADLDATPVPVAAHESFAAAARGGDLSFSPAHDEPSFDEVTLSDVLRWALAFAGLAAIGAVRNPRL